MGSFPSVLEEPTNVLNAGGESSRAVGTQLAPSVHPRAHSLIIKKFTRGKIVLLGIDGAGKTTFARQLIRVASGDSIFNHASSFAGTMGNNDSELAAFYPDPTTHQVAWSYRMECDRYLQLVDLPGRREAREKWYTGLKGEAMSSMGNSTSSPHIDVGVGNGGGTHLNALPLAAIVFVVDVSDRMRFPVVATELAQLQILRERSSRLAKAPFFLLLNKTDRYLSLQLKQQKQLGQPLLSASQQQHQAQLREVRAELRSCVDYELKMLQRRRLYTSTAPAAPVPRTLSHNNPVSPSTVLGESVAAHTSRSLAPTCTIMNSVMECCSQDPESVGAVHAWIKDEMKKVR